MKSDFYKEEENTKYLPGIFLIKEFIEKYRAGENVDPEEYIKVYNQKGVNIDSEDLYMAILLEHLIVPQNQTHMKFEAGYIKNLENKIIENLNKNL